MKKLTDAFNKLSGGEKKIAVGAAVVLIVIVLSQLLP